MRKKPWRKFAPKRHRRRRRTYCRGEGNKGDEATWREEGRIERRQGTEKGVDRMEKGE